MLQTDVDGIAEALCVSHQAVAPEGPVSNRSFYLSGFTEKMQPSSETQLIAMMCEGLGF